jgi:hypothetical protein
MVHSTGTVLCQCPAVAVPWFFTLSRARLPYLFLLTVRNRIANDERSSMKGTLTTYIGSLFPSNRGCRLYPYVRPYSG